MTFTMHRSWGVSLLIGAVAAGAACSSTTTQDGGADAPTGVTLNNCTADMFVDHTAATADRTVSFGGVNGSPLFGYAPPCMRIAAGQSVTFTGNLSVHPLSPGSSPTMTTTGSANNPIPSTSTGSSVMATFPTAGTYPFICTVHYASGMMGVIQVQ